MNISDFNPDSYLGVLLFSSILGFTSLQRKFYRQIQSNILIGIPDKYEGFIIDSVHLPDSEYLFTKALRDSLELWSKQGMRGIWLKVPLEKVAFVPIAVAPGFIYHHAEPSFIMLTRWLSEEECRIPPNASHQVGVGCVVAKGKKLLLVQEKSGPLSGKGIWKLPTGIVDAGEDISVAACREVMEETGVEAEFKSVVCIRQSHGVAFGKSDLFFICILTAKSEEIVMQEAEIAACDWIDIDHYIAQPLFARSELYSSINKIVKQHVEYSSSDSGDCDTASAPPVLLVQQLDVGFRPGKQSLYSFLSR